MKNIKVRLAKPYGVVFYPNSQYSFSIKERMLLIRERETGITIACYMSFISVEIIKEA